jgi:hypothetical protein
MPLELSIIKMCNYTVTYRHDPLLLPKAAVPFERQIQTAARTFSSHPLEQAALANIGNLAGSDHVF